jgi:hypothetical protein
MYRHLKVVPLAEPISIEDMPVAQLLEGAPKKE